MFKDLYPIANKKARRSLVKKEKLSIENNKTNFMIQLSL